MRSLEGPSGCSSQSQAVSAGSPSGPAKHPGFVPEKQF